MKGIEFEVVWWDQDVMEYRVRCSNGAFGGDMKMYEGHDRLAQAAKILKRIPDEC